MSGPHLLDALRCCERLLSHLAGLQTTLLTAFARPGKSGDISGMVQATVETGGLALRSDGEVDTEILDAVVTEHAHGMAAAELSAALHIAPITARRRVETAVDLHDGLPRTHRALTEGAVDRGRAALIAECTSTLEPELRLEVENTIVPLVAGRTAGRLRPLIERAVLIADPETAKKRIEKARRGREVTHRPIKDQLGLIKAVLPAEGAVSVFTLIDLMAGSTKAARDGRSVAERRADALTDLANELLTHGQLDLRGLLDPDDAITDDELTDQTAADDGVGETTANNSDGGNTWYDEDGFSTDEQHPFSATAKDLAVDGIDMIPSEEPAEGWPDEQCAAQPLSSRSISASGSGAREKRRRLDTLTRQGRRPHLTVTMSLSTLMALDQLPGHLEGYGAITAELAQAIAAAAGSISVAVVNAQTGTPEHASARFGYRPSQKQRDIVTTLAATCRFPSCRQPAWRCDLDHRDAYDHNSPANGGATCPCNLDPHCRRHHVMKHRTDWTARREPDGSMNWTSPTGHRYTDAPTELTLPGEWLTRIDRFRTTTSSTEDEHRVGCAEPIGRDETTSVALRVRVAQRRAFRARVLERVRSAQQRGLLGGTRQSPVTDPLGQPNAELIKEAVTRVLGPAAEDLAPIPGVGGRAMAGRTTPSLPDDDNPPF